MDISTLLNPEASTRLRPRNSSATMLAYTLSDKTTPEATPEPEDMKKKQIRAAKDAAKFEKGMTVGVVHYPPFETNDEDLKEKHRKMLLYPNDGIALYPRHIPYNSDKKTFQDKTGRDSFEVFQYTFKHHESSKDWVVMWDYNIGLVRITPFFKALGHIKTVPQKAITMNPGLRDLSFSITGGAIAAQGYWMPYEAAKALAATFCYNIRYALTPIFGGEFPEQCTTPDDPAYKRFSIDPAIVTKCAEEASAWTLGSRISKSPDCESQPSTNLSRPNQHPESPARRLRRRSGRFYGDDSCPDVYNDSHSDDAYPRPIQNARSAAMHMHMHMHTHQANSSKDLTSAATTPSPWPSSVPTSPASRAASAASKRGLDDTDNDADGSSEACSNLNRGVSKRWKVGEFGRDEMLAARALVRLSRGFC